MTVVQWLLDTGVLLSYAEQTSSVLGRELVACERDHKSMVVSAACLAEAYRAASEDAAHLLDVLVNLPAVQVEPLQQDDARVTGLVAQRVGRIGLAHACMLALGSNVPVMTTDSEAALRVLEAALVERMN
ncbi:MAG: hypothetical protein HOV77_24890 [Hamadaea sp.]|uniref:hypothetical protein n=1 Tax=Hamadaea sp. TaxID=2024425 RepID=UPI001842EB49|nr:hypothetical protein [Hamadaea sp.]NUT22422.1 hypothetical protein [Hamadaea sp.]